MLGVALGVGRPLLRLAAGDAGGQPGVARPPQGVGVGQQLGQTSTELIRRGMNVSPTIEIRPGYAFNVMVTQDLVLPGPYDDGVRP